MLSSKFSGHNNQYPPFLSYIASLSLNTSFYITELSLPTFLVSKGNSLSSKIVGG